MSRELPLTSWITDISLKALSSSGYYHHSIIDRLTATSLNISRLAVLWVIVLLQEEIGFNYLIMFLIPRSEINLP